MNLVKAMLMKKLTREIEDVHTSSGVHYCVLRKVAGNMLTMWKRDSDVRGTWDVGCGRQTRGREHEADCPSVTRQDCGQARIRGFEPAFANMVYS